jgi:hypothetical protein
MTMSDLAGFVYRGCCMGIRRRGRRHLVFFGPRATKAHTLLKKDTKFVMVSS